MHQYVDFLDNLNQLNSISRTRFFKFFI